jgi:hypothetical protein
MKYLKEYLPINISVLTKKEHHELVEKLYDKFRSSSEKLDSENLLHSYLVKDEKYQEPRMGPYEYCWNQNQMKIQFYTRKIQSLKDQLNILVDSYDSLFEKNDIPRLWNK